MRYDRFGKINIAYSLPAADPRFNVSMYCGVVQEQAIKLEKGPCKEKEVLRKEVAYVCCESGEYWDRRAQRKDREMERGKMEEEN